VTDHVAAEKAALDSWVLVIGVAEEKGCAEEAERNGPLDRPVAEVEVDNVVSVQGKLAVEEEGEDSSLLGPGEENRTVPEESSGEAAHIVVENCEELDLQNLGEEDRSAAAGQTWLWLRQIFGTQIRYSG
jgi:hypothetical protein